MRKELKATVTKLGLTLFAASVAAAFSTAPAFAAPAISTANPGQSRPHAAPAVTATIAIPAKVSAVGQGTGTGVDTGAACPDVTCGSGSCVCLEGSGSMTGVAGVKTSFFYELSLDTSLDIPNGGYSLGRNYATSGFIEITLPGAGGANVIDLLLQGNSSDAEFSTGFAGFTGSFIGDGGSGTWAKAYGAGNCSLYVDWANTGDTTVTLNGGLSK